MARNFRSIAATITFLLVASAPEITAMAQTFEEGMRAYRTGDYDTAYRAFCALAEKGDDRAQGSLGDMYRKGYGVAQDHTEAANWYGRAAEKGSAYAQNSLGIMYRDGLGVDRNPERAYAWFDLAARRFPVSRSTWRDRAAQNRDRVAGSLSPQALERAKRMAAEWRPGASLVGSRSAPPPAGCGVASGLDRNLALILIGLVVVVVVAVFFLLRVRSSRRRPVAATSRNVAAHGRTRPLLPEVNSVIAGKAIVTDGDGLSVSGYRIRFAGLDAPELDQWAKHRHGYWIQHGKRVKNSLKRAVHGKHVRVKVEEYDQYDRVIGAVTCDERDVGEWLVRNGHAVAAYGDRYKQAESEAKRERRGMWGHAVNWHPKDWRRRFPGRG